MPHKLRQRETVMPMTNLRRYTRRMSSPVVRMLLCSLALTLAAGPVLSQWIWADKDGRKVYSDRPPPPDIPAKSILKQPPGAARAAASPAPVAAPADGAAPAAAEPGARAASAPAPLVTGKDAELDARKKAAEAAEAAKRREQEQRAEAVRAENCERARRARATLDSGVRIAQTNARGEREILDDQGRAAEMQRADQAIAQFCGPRPTAAQAK